MPAASTLTIQPHLSASALPIISVLISGDEDIVLVDTCFVLDDADALVKAIKATGKNLRDVLITHAHPDHYFGMEALRQAFPSARFIASAGTVDLMADWPAKVRHWGEVFGVDAVPWSLTLPDVHPGGHLELDGHRIELIEVRGTECLHMTLAYLPDSRSLLAGDMVYNGIHLLTADVGDLDSWISEIERVRNQYEIELVCPCPWRTRRSGNP